MLRFVVGNATGYNIDAFFNEAVLENPNFIVAFGVTDPRPPDNSSRYKLRVFNNLNPPKYAWVGVLLSLLAMGALVMVVWMLLMLRVPDHTLDVRNYVQLVLSVFLVFGLVIYLRLWTVIQGGPPGTMVLWTMRNQNDSSFRLQYHMRSFWYAFLPLLRPVVTLYVDDCCLRVSYATTSDPWTKDVLLDLASRPETPFHVVVPGFFAKYAQIVNNKNTDYNVTTMDTITKEETVAKSPFSVFTITSSSDTITRV